MFATENDPKNEEIKIQFNAPATQFSFLINFRPPVDLECEIYIKVSLGI